MVVQYHIKERRVGLVRRCLRLPTNADQESIRAQYGADGVLRVCVDKKAGSGDGTPSMKKVKITDHEYPFAK
jgi:HSP20 family molecular chaperone IbpA